MIDVVEFRYLIPVLISATLVSAAAVRATALDRFRNPVTDALVVVGGLLPWLAVAVMCRWLPYSGYPIAAGLYGSGALFLCALIRFRLGPRFPNWENASFALFAGVLANVGFFISFMLPFAHGE